MIFKDLEAMFAGKFRLTTQIKFSIFVIIFFGN